MLAGMNPVRLTRLALAMVAFAVAAGCTQPIRVYDAGVDARVIDAPTVRDVGTDTPGLDASVPRDASDSGSDAPTDVPADVALDTGVDAPSSVCDRVYGALPGYILCAETSTTCSMVVLLDGDDCNIACRSVADGNDCVSALNDGPLGMECVGMGGWACGQNGMSAICTCRLR